MEQGGLLRLCSDGRRLPCQIGFGSEEAKGRSADHVTLKIEGVVDGGVGGKKSLGGSLRLELLLFALPSSNGQMRVLGPVVTDHASWAMSAR